MEALRLSMLFLHFLGLAALVGGFLAQWRAGTAQVSTLMLGGAGAQVLTGVLLVFARNMQDLPVDTGKVIVKLGIGLVVAVLAQVGRRRSTSSPGLFYSIGLLAVVNIGVAVFWT